MSQECRNIYQISRESAGMTQERASELIDISVESLRAYEQGRRCPPDPIVIRMIEIYDARHLAYQHLKTSAEVGRMYMPEIEIRNLPAAILKLQKEVNDFLRCREELIEITCDGKITDEEQPRWEEILHELDDITGAIMSLMCAN